MARKACQRADGRLKKGWRYGKNGRCVKAGGTRKAGAGGKRKVCQKVDGKLKKGWTFDRQGRCKKAKAKASKARASGKPSAASKESVRKAMQAAMRRGELRPSTAQRVARAYAASVGRKEPLHTRTSTAARQRRAMESYYRAGQYPARAYKAPAKRKRKR